VTKKILTTTCAAMLSISAAAHASTIAYWQFDEGTGTTAGSTVNGLNGTLAASGSGGVLPTWTNQTVGGVIQDGVGGPIINASNTTSLFFDNTGGVDGVSGKPNTTVGSIVTVADNPLLQPAAFTAEMWMKVNTIVMFPALINKSKDGSNSTWMMDLTDSGNLRSRFDTAVQGNQTPNSGTSVANGQWHHVALTYDGTTARLYVDYVLKTTQIINGSLAYTSAALNIGNSGGGRAFDGWIDEVRLTDSALTSDQFLRVVAIPEPASMAAMLGAMALLARRRARA
jgi:hypothetical protein